MIRVAAHQFAPVFKDDAANSARICSLISDGALLHVFPEAALTGYCAKDASEARELSRQPSCEPLMAIAETCAAQKAFAVVGFIEDAGDSLYNSAALFGPDGLIAVYRKAHLPCLGVDRFVSAGDALPVFDLPFGKVGVLICFDNRFPESARTLTLKGADIICLPTNWPNASGLSSNIICPARAMENNVYFVAANRVGTEGAFEFVGRSKVIEPGGIVIAAADHKNEESIFADCDLALSRKKRLILVEGEYELDLIDGRRPDLYSDLTLN